MPPPGPLGCFGGKDAWLRRLLYRKGGHQRLSRPSVRETLAKEPLQFGPCGRPGPGSAGAQFPALLTQGPSGSCTHRQCPAILLSCLPERFAFPAWKNSSQLMTLLLRLNEITFISRREACVCSARPEKWLDSCPHHPRTFARAGTVPISRPETFSRTSSLPCLTIAGSTELRMGERGYGIRLQRPV